MEAAADATGGPMVYRIGADIGGTFTDVAKQAGVADANGYYGLGVLTGDFDDDGLIDIFVANAAATAFKPLLEQQAHHIDKTFAITVDAFVLAVQEAARLMPGRGGTIITVSGIDARRYIPLHGALAAAKGALEVLTAYLACELAPQGIRVNGVNPGFVNTDSAHVFGEKIYHLLEKNIVTYTPMQRVGTPDDIANVVAFLCSEDAAWICGQTLTVDGGLSLTSPFDIRHLLAKSD